VKSFGFLRIIFKRRGPEKGMFLFLLSLYEMSNAQYVNIIKVTSVPIIKVASDFKSMYRAAASNVLVMAI
jgi:hypothetical protein